MKPLVTKMSALSLPSSSYVVLFSNIPSVCSSCVVTTMSPCLLRSSSYVILFSNIPQCVFFMYSHKRSMQTKGVFLVGDVIIFVVKRCWAILAEFWELDTVDWYVVMTFVVWLEGKQIDCLFHLNYNRYFFKQSSSCPGESVTVCLLF
jgi:hypothetical protein